LAEGGWVGRVGVGGDGGVVDEDFFGERVLVDVMNAR
jgi:hypothetical protein